METEKGMASASFPKVGLTGLLVVLALLSPPAWARGEAPGAEAFLHLDSAPTPGQAVLDTTAVGAAFGLADYLALRHLDHPVNSDTGGLFALAKTPTFPAELIGGTAIAALWEGGDTRVGRTLWQGLDGAALSGVSTYLLKYSFQRERPSQTRDPNQWFQGVHAQSFPSGDVSAITGLVTPAILEYGPSHPAAYLLAAIPAFDMVARVKAEGHWQTDVVGGALVGALSGYYAHEASHPFILSLLPGGVEVGLRQRF